MVLILKKTWKFLILNLLISIFLFNLAHAKIDIKQRSYCLHDAVKDISYKKKVKQICKEIIGSELIVIADNLMQVNLGKIIDLIKVNKDEKVNLIANPDYSLGDDYAPNSTDIFFYIKYNNDFLLIHDPDKNDNEIFYYCKSENNCNKTSTILY